MVGPTAMVASAEEEFLRRLDRTLWTAAGIAGAAALIVGIVTTRHLTHPLRDLHSAARRMAGGDLGVRVTPSGGPDLSDLAHAFNQMAENLERQEQARRALVADVAHDLRTPVTVIQGTVDALLDGVFPPTNEHLRSIRQEAQRLGRLVHDLRDLSLVDTGQLRLEPRTINATDLAREALARASHQAAQHGVTLSLKASPDSTRPGEVPILVEADPHRMAQVLDNLLGNALRYIPDGGAITVHIERYAPQGASAYNKSQVAITVEDTGPGIAPEDQPHVFERFFRVDRARARDLSGAPAAGSGLGLTIVKGLVEASGGRVWVTSEPGQGARFTFTLPATPTPTPTPAPTPITTLGD